MNTLRVFSSSCSGKSEELKVLLQMCFHLFSTKRRNVDKDVASLITAAEGAESS